MKTSTIPKKHMFSERARSVTSTRQRSRDISPKMALNNSRLGNTSYMHSPSSKSIHQSNVGTPSNQSQIGGMNINELTFNVNDDHKTLINKNRKLCNILIQASTKISQMNERMNFNENRYKKEKEEMVKKLDKITVNYKVYAESHQNFIKLKVEYDNLRKDYDHNYKILTYYEEIIKSSISNFIQVFKKISDFLLDYKSQESSYNFLLKLREKYKGDLRDYLNKIDGYNFRELYTQIKIINDEIEQYDVEIYKPKFPQNLENSKGSSRENYEKVIKPVVKNNFKPHENSVQDTSSSKDCSPNIEEKKNNNYMNTEKSNRENEFESLSEKVNENLQQLYDTLYKNSVKADKKSSSKIASNNINVDNIIRTNQRKNEWIEEKKDGSFKENEEDDHKDKIYVTAIYDFQPKKKNELAFKKGDVMLIEQVQDTGWWLASMNGKSGLIPFNYIRIND